ncbi:patatin-like phospholipase [Geobacter sp. OR-1]|uniref:patatin-like phospholipase family protein n=1 Tax=Geobacter sp. OR-1 TaxID=1266765 RepID=UPI000541D7F3|nr:patatin-like phospholipase family protein [Geobacter sp. OR-1]GAM10153.1 patatin-like phospholipase [Geobacter sp. OR-1]
MSGSPAQNDPAPLTLDKVLEEERNAIDPQSGRSGGSDGYTALCLSGGGIRSATFNLGILQGLAKAGLLKQFDYLSTVSGGGYIGAWLSAWIARSCFPYVNHQLASQQDVQNPGTEPEPIRQLRNFSNYLSPKVGLMNADTWTLAATFIRNMLINWAVILPFLAAALMLPRFMIHVVALNCGFWPIVTILSLGGLMVFFSIIYEAVDLPSLGNAKIEKVCFKICFLTPFLGYAVLFAIAWGWFVQHEPLALLASAGLSRPYLLDSAIANLKTAFAIMGAAYHSAAWGVGLTIASIRTKQIPHPYKVLWFLFSAACSGALGGYLLILSAESLNHLIPNDLPAYACFAAPLFIGAFLTAGLLQVALVRLASEETDREWWASAAAHPLIVTCLWLAGSALVYYGPQLFFSHISTLQSTAVSLFGIFSGAATAFFGHSDSTPASARKEEDLKKKGINLLMSLAALLFIATFLILLSLGTSWILEGRPDNFSIDHHVLQLHNSCKKEDYQLALYTFGCFILCGGLISYFVDINRFSLHCMYRNRLIRSYLGGSRKQPVVNMTAAAQTKEDLAPCVPKMTDERAPNPLTGFDWKDNIDMSALRERPFHIINIALNVAADEKLSWQQRKAESFTISPLHAGGKEIGYRPINKYAAPQSKSLLPHEGISLGTAMAISGAAASPNMGYHSSPLITFIMALFNLRLGWWLGHTGDKGGGTWRNTGPKWSAGIMFREMFGRTSDHYKYIYLSDGGHFENLGLYEMALRRCRFIVAIDAGCDEKKSFEDLGNALRKIRIDLCTTVTLDLTPIIDKNKRCASGTIDYPAVDGKPAFTGRIVYIKPVIDEKEPADIYNYYRANRTFPHEPTSDQWFSESQFESYRMLGFHTMKEILANNWWCGSTGRFLDKVEAYMKKTNGRSNETDMDRSVGC